MSNFYRILLLALQKVLMVQIIPQQIFNNQFSAYLLNDIWKNMTCFIFHSQVVETISTDLSVWLWTVTQFNTHKNELFLKMLLVIENRLLITTWKYWIWISKNELSLSTTAWKGCWSLFYPKLCVDISLYFS